MNFAVYPLELNRALGRQQVPLHHSLRSLCTTNSISRSGEICQAYVEKSRSSVSMAKGGREGQDLGSKPRIYVSWTGEVDSLQ